MDGPSPRVTRGRVILLGVITFVALAYGTLRWSSTATDPNAGAPTAAPAATSASAAGAALPPGHGVSLEPNASGAPDTTTLAAAEQLLACLRSNESRDEYDAVSPSGQFFGAYQFDQQTWDNTAAHARLPGLVGVQPDVATPSEQDQMALALLQWQGGTPWHGDPCVA